MGETENDLLMREMSHRVANDMSVAVAALRAAGRLVGGDPTISAALARMQACAEVQRLLCADAPGVVDVTALLARVCSAMADAEPGPGRVVSLRGGSLLSSGKEARLFLLTVHELVRNALVHGCRFGGPITVDIGDEDGVTSVVVASPGSAGAWTRAGGQGAGIVDGLAGRLGGRVARGGSAAVTRVEVRVPSLAVREPRAEVA